MSKVAYCLRLSLEDIEEMIRISNAAMCKIKGDACAHIGVAGQSCALLVQVLHELTRLGHSREEARVGLHVSQQPGQLGQQHQREAVHEKELTSRKQ